MSDLKLIYNKLEKYSLKELEADYRRLQMEILNNIDLQRKLFDQIQARLQLRAKLELL